ncbi:MAG TPA: hypothetical protein VGL82_12795 [Bryobacteraceae bacterium]
MDRQTIGKISLLFAVGVFCVSPAAGALTVTITSANQTQAVLQEQGFSGPCIIQVSTLPSMTPLHPDFNNAEYSGSATDTTRADTITSADGLTRLVTLGHQTDDRALAAFTTYYYQVSGCGDTATGTFTTANLSTGTTRTEQSPFNGSKWGNLGLPTFDWTKKQSYVDPMTGVTLIPMALSIQTWRTGCGAGGCTSNSRTFKDWAGGTGWTNPAGVALGATTNAVTSTTNPVDLYADLSGFPDPLPYDFHAILEDLGIVVWGGANSASPADRVIDLCIFFNPAAGCAGNTVQLTLPQGKVAHVSSGSADLDGAFPSAFPSSPFFGWTQSSAPLIRMENRETFGTLTTSGHTLTIASLSAAQHFSNVLSSGQRIFVSGSSCPNSLCTIAGAPSAPGVISVNETPGTASASFRAYGWGLRVWKDTAVGTATIGLQYKLAGSGAPIGIQAGTGDRCSAVSVTSGDGKQGYLCQLTSLITGNGYLAFVATDATTRILSSRSGFSFDDIQGNVFYSGGKNSSGGLTVFKNTYTGDYTHELNYNYTCSSASDCPALADGVTSVDLMPHSANADLDQQIEANQGGSLPAYNSALYGTWKQSNGAIGYYGSSGHFAFFCNVYAGQGQGNAGGPGWCAAIDLSQSPAKVVRLIHTLDGTGAPNARFGSLHAAQEVDSNANTLVLTLDPVAANSTTTLHGGPFQAPVQAILMADGTWNTNTCLDWPAGQGSCPNPNYSRACPANSAPYIECVTFQLPQNGVCNVAATSVETAMWPCPWNSKYSQHPIMQAGDNSADLAGNGGGDSEHFHILSIAPDINNTSRVIAARNGTYDYCSISPWHGLVDPLSAQFAGQLKHANGWTLTMMPGSVNTCGSAELLQEEVSGSVQELGHSFTGHSQSGRGPTGINFVTTQYTIYNTPFSSLGQVPTIFNSTSNPSFHGSPAQIGSQLQSYTDDSQLNAGASGHAWALDTDPFVACFAEQFGCGLPRSLVGMGGSVYKIQPNGSAAASNATYKIQPMVGWAGRYQLKDVSGPSSSVDSTPYSMCLVIIAGECHAGSALNDIYVNVPVAFDPGYCAPSMSWVNVPCVFFGDNAPAGGIRQFRISQGDSNGAYSRFISNGWSSLGRHYPYTHATVYQNGQWAMEMGTNPMDGFSMTGFMISLPPWVEKRDPDNDFKTMIVQIPRGPQYAEIQFGYSRYIGPGNAPANGFFCTSRADGCNTSSVSLFNFESEARTNRQCIAGCRFTIPAVAPNLMYYRIRRSTDGVNWTASDIQATALP